MVLARGRNLLTDLRHRQNSTAEEPLRRHGPTSQPHQDRRCDIGDNRTYDDNALDLLELASKLRLAVEASQMGVWEFDARSGQVHWDDRMLEIYGIEDGQNVRPDDFWESHLHPDDLDATVAYAERCTTLKKDFRRDYRIVREDGGIRHIRSLARNVSAPGRGARLIGVNIDVTKDYLRAEELQKAQHQLRYDVRHDALTGLGNRRHLDEMTDALFARLTPRDRYCVMHLDLDHFKQINDTLGHFAGDHVLSSLAAGLMRVIGRRGAPFRVGGDEFVVLFEVAPEEAIIMALCEDLVSSFSAPLSYGGQNCSVSVSIGYAFGDGPPAHASEVFVKADAALYAAKSAGRGCFRAFSDDIAAPALITPDTRREIAAAIAEGQFTCLYQPQFNAQTLEIVGAEALVRWECPERGTLRPDAFLPHAARSGLMAELDACVMNIVARQQTMWWEQGVPYPVISLNTSPDRLRMPTLPTSVQEMLGSHHKIALELLETAFLDTLDKDLAARLAMLRATGLRIALDDFGSGHSSVAALQTIQPDQVKIDRSLIARLAQTPRQVQTIQSLAKIARLEGAEIAIEGLETGLHLAAIRAVDCDVLQGFALAHPMTATAFAQHLQGLRDAAGPYPDRCRA